MPFKFTGALKKVMMELSDTKLAPAEEVELKKATDLAIAACTAATDHIPAE